MRLALLPINGVNTIQKAARERLRYSEQTIDHCLHDNVATSGRGSVQGSSLSFAHKVRAHEKVRKGDREFSRTRGGWSRFSRNVHLIFAHHMQCIVSADSVGWRGLRERTLQPMANAL